MGLTWREAEAKVNLVAGNPKSPIRGSEKVRVGLQKGTGKDRIGCGFVGEKRVKIR